MCVQVRNVFTGLFLASIGLVISPVFILEHVRLLGVGALIVLIVKGMLISLVVWNFKYSWNTSLAVGFSLAQVRPACLSSFVYCCSFAVHLCCAHMKKLRFFMHTVIPA